MTQRWCSSDTFSEDSWILPFIRILAVQTNINKLCKQKKQFIRQCIKPQCDSMARKTP